MGKASFNSVWRRIGLLALLGMIGGWGLIGCRSPLETRVTPTRTPVATPTPDTYPLDLPFLGVRLRLPSGWQGVQAMGPERPWVFVVPLERYSDEDVPLMPLPLLQAEEEEILIPPDPPYLLAYAYQRPLSRPWRAQEVYFGLTELGILTTEVVEDFGRPEPFRVPRGSGWRSDLLLKGPAGEYRARLSLLPMPFPQWIFVLWGMSPPDTWPELEEIYQQILLWLNFRQTPPPPAPPSDS